MVRNCTSYSHWQWEREENSYRVCREVLQSALSFPPRKKKIHFSAEQKVNLVWYSRALGERRLWQNKDPISTKKERKNSGVFVTSNTYNIAPTTVISKAQSRATPHHKLHILATVTRHSRLASSMSHPISPARNEGVHHLHQSGS